jgi:cardiolipin synthase
MSSPKLLLPLEYVETATDHINRATKHVSFLCMMVTDDTATDELIDALAAAAKRGVDVQVAADTFTYGELGGHFIPLKYYTKKTRTVTKMSRELIQAGVRFTWLGRFSTLPFTGRTHSKCLVVDDTVYSFGGVNLYDESLGYVDYMFEHEDPLLALELRDEITRLVKADGSNFAYRSHEFSIGQLGKVLVDGGFQGDSIIYRRALQLTREAEEVLFVSQYCPAGRLSRALRKTNSKLYFNKPTNATFWNKIIIGANMAFSGQKTLYKKETYLHAKFMIFTMKNGDKIAITGSHNFVPGGVIFGTRELALETTDKRVIRQLESFFKSNIK